MRKKLLYMVIVGAITTSLCIGCGSNDTQQTDQSETIENTDQPTPTTEQSTTDTEENAEVNTEEPTEEPGATPALESNTDQPTEQPDVEEPTEPADPTEEEPEELTTTPEPIAEPTAQYTYTDLSTTMYAQRSLNVRDLPSTDGNKLGALSTNQEVVITGQCNETKWYRFEYNGTVGYASNSYLKDTMVEVAQATQPTTDNTQTNTVINGSIWKTDIVYPNEDPAYQPFDEWGNYATDPSQPLMSSPSPLFEILYFEYPNLNEYCYGVWYTVPSDGSEDPRATQLKAEIKQLMDAKVQELGASGTFREFDIADGLHKEGRVRCYTLYFTVN